uniref:Uncharacterized protein n=1 Tax=Apteryx owenii TaxID=8824 RepID=A0A8B9S2F8_APTOW
MTISADSVEKQILSLERQRGELLEVNKQWDRQFRSMKQHYEKKGVGEKGCFCFIMSENTHTRINLNIKILTGALHEMKEENKLLKEKNASMIRKKERYECEISRLNKVRTGVTKKACSNSAFSVSFVTRAPTPFSKGPTFSLVFLLLLMYLKKPFLLSLTSLARFNSKRALAFLVASLHTLTTFLYSSQVACPPFHFLYTSFLWLSFARSSLLIHAGLLPPLLDFLLIGMHCS